LFDLSLKLNSFPIREAQLVLKDIQQKNEIEFEAYINAKKREIVSYHLQHNPFYKSLAKNVNPEDWTTIPIMTKQNLQKPLKELLSDNFSKSKVYIDKTSGASGIPFIFAKDKFCHALTWAIIIDRFSWYGVNFNRSKQARFYGIPKDTIGYIKEKIKDLLKERQVEAPVITDFISILENCELARYTPITQVTMKNDYEKSVTTIGAIDKQIR